MARPRQGGAFETIKVKVSQVGYAEAIQSAASMCQPLDLWASDAIAHHIYRCEQIQARERYQADVLAAERSRNATPLAHDPQYQVNRPKPTITRNTGKGSSGPVLKHSSY